MNLVAGNQGLFAGQAIQRGRVTDNVNAHPYRQGGELGIRSHAATLMAHQGLLL